MHAFVQIKPFIIIAHNFIKFSDIPFEGPLLSLYPNGGEREGKNKNNEQK